jgi:hypothetical protein
MPLNSPDTFLMDVLLITPVVSPVGQSLLQCAYIFPFLRCVPAMDGAAFLHLSYCGIE